MTQSFGNIVLGDLFRTYIFWPCFVAALPGNTIVTSQAQSGTRLKKTDVELKSFVLGIPER